MADKLAGMAEGRGFAEVDIAGGVENVADGGTAVVVDIVVELNIPVANGIVAVGIGFEEDTGTDSVVVVGSKAPAAAG